MRHPRWALGLRKAAGIYPFLHGTGVLDRVLIRAEGVPAAGCWRSARIGRPLDADLMLDLSSPLQRKVFTFPRVFGRAYLRAPLARLLQRVLGPGDGFFDIGANLGFYTVLARRLVGAAGRVHAFEPEPTALASLRRTIEKNGWNDSVVAHGLALTGAGGGRRVLHIGRDGTSSSLVAEHAARAAARYVGDAMVDAASLDELVAAGTIPRDEIARLRLIKIDVEGEEANVVRGSLSTLAGLSRALAWIEVRGPRRSTRAPGTFEPVRALLAGIGYTPLRWDERTGARPVPPSGVIGREDVLFARPDSW